MRVLHTSDWHLGAVLKQVPRLPDQLERVEEVLTICDEREVDLLLVAGDVVDETSPNKMPQLVRQLGELLRSRLETGLSAVFLAGNHDRAWIFPLLQVAGELYSSDSASSQLHFCSRPELRTVTSSSGERVRLMLLPYPWPWNYSLEAVQGVASADRRRQVAMAVQQRIEEMAAEAEAGEKLPTILVGHLLVTGVQAKRHELTEADDVPVPQVALPNYHYRALGHVHQAMAVGKSDMRYSGSIERVDFGEAGEEKSVVLVDIGPSGLRSEPGVIPLHPAELFELEWRPGDSIEEKAATVPAGAICKLTIYLERGASAQPIQSAARNLIGKRLLFPPDIKPLSSQGEGHASSAAFDKVDWRERVRSWVASEMAGDPLQVPVTEAVEELIAEEVEA